MSRIRLAMVALAAAVALVIPTTGSTAGEATPLLTGTVGPGFTITLKKGTTRVRTLRAGTYRIRVTDRSNLHDFRLKGSTTKMITGVAFVGTKTVTVTLRRGTVTYYCAPHAIQMKGTFRVT
jgi:plastocyanin